MERARRRRQRKNNGQRAQRKCVAVLFAHTSPFAETSADAGPRTNGPHSCSTIAAAVFSSDGKTVVRAPWPRWCVLHSFCKREPADGADVFRQDEANT
jgi:hypothetical protein